MDRSMDSIGSCSLDVDADSSDISDTSGSLNFPTPLSVKDITREFTANIRERCTVRNGATTSTTAVTSAADVAPLQQLSTTAIVDPVSGEVRMVLTQSSQSKADGAAYTAATANSNPTAANTTTVTATTPCGGSGGGGGGSAEKKPSYLNLACCVNGYSNLTTYDSKIRQDINKSREVSPIRPSSQSIQYCKRNNALAPPVLHTIMPNVSAPHTKQPLAASYKYGAYESNYNGNANSNGNGNANGNGNMNADQHENGNGNGQPAERRNTSFIQQRVERLYGPGALAQGFYSPKKTPRSNAVSGGGGARAATMAATTASDSNELTLKFQQLSPSRDYSEFKRKLDANTSATITAERPSADVQQAENDNSNDLPCMRHLSQEFRAQLPTISPKRQVPRLSPTSGESNGERRVTGRVVVPPAAPPPFAGRRSDEVDHTAVPFPMDSNVSLVVLDIPSKYGATPSQVTLTNASGDDNTQSQAPTMASAVTIVAAAPSANGNGAQNGVAEKKDGNYFLVLLKNEQTRLLALAAVAEKYIEALANNPDVTEDTHGFLRAASGKARLLVSQKMKQFEGLCHNNLNRSPEDKFPTTLDDLQGFWDMVYLQIDHIDAIFAEIELMKSNDWKKPQAIIDANTPMKTQQNKASKTVNPKSAPSKLSVANGAGGATAGGNKTATPMSAAALKREAQRKQLLEMKRQKRIAMTASAFTTESATSDSLNSIEIFIDEKLLSS